MKNVIIINEIKRLADKAGGILQPEIVVEAARDKKSVLHDRFTWDNDEAAHQYRLIEARCLISAAVEIIPQTGKEMPTFVSVSIDRVRPAGGYRYLGHVVSNAELREQYVNDALHELGRMQRKYQDIKELADVWRSVDKAKKKIA
jgi:hypothetical protein